MPSDQADVSAYDMQRFIAVIDHVLELDYLRPNLRRRVVEMRRRMVRQALAGDDGPAEEPPADTA